jgi:hypothetical protein
MRNRRRWHSVLYIVPVVLALLVLATNAQAQGGKAKVDRLVMGLILPYRDYMRPWIVGTPDHNIQHDPAFDLYSAYCHKGLCSHVRQNLPPGSATLHRRLSWTTVARERSDPFSQRRCNPAIAVGASPLTA